MNRRLDKAQQESEQQFQTLANRIPQLCWMAAPDGSAFWYNQRWYDFTGTTFEEMEGMGWKKVFHPDHLDRVIEKIKHCLATGEDWEDTFPIRGKDGKFRWFLTRGLCIRDMDGNIVRWFGTNTDISELHEEQEALMRERSAIVESSYDAIIGMTLDGIITSWNPAAERLFGYSASEALGKSITILLPPDYPNDVAGILRKVANRESTYDYETVRRRTDGTLLDVSLRVSPICDTSGKVVGAATIAHDITRRKKAEEALLQGEKLAATGRLAASIAHEVNNPLAGALNAIYLAGINPDKSGQMLKIAERELRRAAHITQQTLGFYRDTSGHMQVKIHELVREVLDVYETKLRERNITVRYIHRCGCNSHKGCPDECQQCGKCLRISAGELRQIISNLLANGIEALPYSGEMEIRVSRASGRVQLTVADNGQGIQTEHLKRIFQPFFTTKEEMGTGLGLWVTQELVRKYNGDIKVRSRMNKGTVFRITLPESPAAECCRAA